MVSEAARPYFEPVSSRVERLKEWLAEATPVSLGILALGIASLVVGIVGTIAFLWIEGLTPSEELVETLTSQSEGAILYTAAALGVVAIVAGFLLYKRMPTKAAREASISGAVLGLQALLFALVLLGFRRAEKFDIFVRQFFSFDVLAPFMGEFLNAAKNTITLAVIAQAIGMVLGLFLSMLVLSNRVAVRAPARAYINVIRGTPLLVQLSIGYLGVVTGLGFRVSVYATAAVILGLNAGAYTAEIFRPGIQSLEPGQLEAARSLGMS